MEGVIKMIYKKEKTVSYDDICLVPRYSDLSSRSEADISQLGFRNPIINSPMIHTTSPEMLSFLTSKNMLCTIHRYFKSAEEQLKYVKDAIGDKYAHVIFSVGKCTDWIQFLIDNGIMSFCVDMAHGDSKTCVDTVKYIYEYCDLPFIIAGNVATGDGYRRLIGAGASMVRVGIASGSICSTAKNTAFGVPMVTSLLECAEVKNDIGGKIIADGGTRSAADILKAIACGSDFVFCGKLLASTNLGIGPFYDRNKHLLDHMYIDMHYQGVQYPSEIAYVEYAGMASHEMRMRNGSHDTKNISIEGVSGLIKYSGKTEDLIDSIEANLRAGMSYCGARNWKEFYDRAIIREMSTAGIMEKETHLDG